LQRGGTKAVPGLIAAFTLGMLGSSAKGSVPSLIAVLRDQNAWVRRNAVEALGMIGQPAESVVPALAAVLADSLRDESA
jgi:HEAT repeat protein